MLPAEQRLQRSRDFTEVVRQGRRASRTLLTVHLLLPAPDQPRERVPARAGLVVSKAVGGSVVRHRTSRRLRHLLPHRLAALPDGSRLVVRASPLAGAAPSAALEVDLDGALAAAARPRAPRRDR